MANNNCMASSHVLTISGTGLHEDLIIDDWSNYPTTERFYSSNNNFDFHKIWFVRGYDLFSLIGTENLKKDRNYDITFIASDGLVLTWKIDQLKNLYYYPDFTVNTEQLVLPMIGFWRAQLFDHQGHPHDVTWEKRSLTDNDRDDRAPRLYLGQEKGNVSDKNQQFFIRNLLAIVIDEAGETEFEGPEDGSVPKPEEQPQSNNEEPVILETENADSELVDRGTLEIDQFEELEDENLPLNESIYNNGLQNEKIADGIIEAGQHDNANIDGLNNEESSLWIILIIVIVALIILLAVINIFIKRR